MATQTLADFRNEYRKERINGRPVRVYIGGEPTEPGEEIPF